MIKIIDKKIDKHILQEICDAHFKTMVKFVVDIKLKKMGVGGELHSDAEELLINEGSNQEDIWGANLYPYKSADERLELLYYLLIFSQTEIFFLKNQNYWKKI
ncbi:hypothetical protein EB821_05825 [Candidatus Marinimicrobia bacterium PRS2]|nr:hypothetical protein EB821_05825 [Candidatus Marinimicrobia bacterium PRS2]